MPDAVDDGPFFHGTTADVCPGELLTAGHPSNYRPEIVMNHIYFTALVDGAGLAAEIAPTSDRVLSRLACTAWSPLAPSRTTRT